MYFLKKSTESWEDKVDEVIQKIKQKDRAGIRRGKKIRKCEISPGGSIVDQ